MGVWIVEVRLRGAVAGDCFDGLFLSDDGGSQPLGLLECVAPAVGVHLVDSTLLMRLMALRM